MTAQKGMILVTTAIIILLLNLLVLTGLKMVLDSFKSLNQLKQAHLFFVLFETRAKKLLDDTNIENKSACIIEEQDPNDVMRLLKNKKGCVLHQENEAFYYFIERLGIFPCLQSNKASTEHFRLSLLTQGKYHAFLQIRSARLVKSGDCEKNPHQIHLGIISWRYLS